MRLNELKWSGKWIVPSATDIKDEWDVEYALPRRNWKGRAEIIGATFPIFDDVEDMISKVRDGHVMNMSSNMWDTTHNLSKNHDIDEVKSMVATYSRPRDVDRIVKGFEDGADMPMAIIIRGTEGSWILSGNTRLNVARLMGIPQKVIVVDAV